MGEFRRASRAIHKGRPHKANEAAEAIALAQAFHTTPWDIEENMTGEWYDLISIYFDELKKAQPKKKGK